MMITDHPSGSLPADHADDQEAAAIPAGAARKTAKLLILARAVHQLALSCGRST
jgi:hypothetical protein